MAPASILQGDYVAVKVPVFSFEKLHDVDIQLGPEMKSTGEVLGIARTFEEALYKGLVAAGYKMKKEGGVLISVRDARQAGDHRGAQTGSNGWASPSTPLPVPPRP